jgi:hypothetical protein
VNETVSVESCSPTKSLLEAKVIYSDKSVAVKSRKMSYVVVSTIAPFEPYNRISNDSVSAVEIGLTKFSISI